MHLFLIAGFIAAIVPTLAVGQPQKQAAADPMSQMHEAMATMEKDMGSAPMTGDPDKDFVAMMIPHHQGAIDMAKLYLKTGKDAKMRKMAEKIIKDQESEISQFRAWQGGAGKGT